MSLLAVTIAFGVMGVMGLVAPGFVAGVFGSKLTDDGRNETRAVYGGYGIAVALALDFAGKHERFQAGIYFATAAALFGMASGRIVSVVVGDRLGSAPFVFFFVELALAWVLFDAI